MGDFRILRSLEQSSTSSSTSVAANLLAYKTLSPRPSARAALEESTRLTHEEKHNLHCLLRSIGLETFCQCCQRQSQELGCHSSSTSCLCLYFGRHRPTPPHAESPCIPRHLPLLSKPNAQIAALASLTSHFSPLWDSSCTSLSSAHSSDEKLSLKLSRRSSFNPAHLLSFAVILLVLVIQLLKEPSDQFDPSLTSILSSKPRPSTCENTVIFKQTPPTSEPREMTVLESAEKVAAEFEYTADDVRKGVKAFLSQMSPYPRQVEAVGRS